MSARIVGTGSYDKLCDEIEGINTSPLFLTFNKEFKCGGVAYRDADFMSKLGYLLWVLRGANLLKPLQYYTRAFDLLSDDGETLRGAYGCRMRYWIGADALQEAININQNIDKEDEFVKPNGVDQLQMVFRDLNDGLGSSCIQIFDPAIDFDPTNYVPDLYNVVFCNNHGQLDIVLNYSCAYASSIIPNDLFLFKFIQVVLSRYLSCLVGEIHIVANKWNGAGRKTVDSKFLDKSEYVDLDRFDFILTVACGVNDFWKEFQELLNFEMHLRMQINDKVFSNEEVSVIELSTIMDNKLLSKMNITLLRDIGYCLMVCALMKYANNLKPYSEFIMSLVSKINSQFLKAELLHYAVVNEYSRDIYEIGYEYDRMLGK